MQAVARAFASFGTQPHRPQGRVRWTDELKERLKNAAQMLPDNRSLADELELPYEAVRRMRLSMLGPSPVPHITQRGSAGVDRAG